MDLNLIKLLVLDVDGVMTDGKLYYNDKGEVQKVFDVKDGLGIKLANKIISVCIISGNPSIIIEKRAKDLGVSYCFIDIANKKECLNQLILSLKLKKENVAYIGDDLNDIPVRSLVSLFACPSDAHLSVKKISDVILDCKGGNGAVREFIDAILLEKGLIAEFEKGIKISNI